MTISIRKYREGDLVALQELTVEAFEPVCIDKNIELQFGPIRDQDWAWRKSRHLADDVRRDPDGIFIAEAGGSMVGYITTWSDSPAGIGNIPNMAVDGNFRGQGIGRQLIAVALDHFRQLGLTHARIETLAQNPIGQRLYPSMGFQEVARQIHYCIDLSTASGEDES